MQNRLFVFIFTKTKKPSYYFYFYCSQTCAFFHNVYFYLSKSLVQIFAFASPACAFYPPNNYLYSHMLLIAYLISYYSTLQAGSSQLLLESPLFSLKDLYYFSGVVLLHTRVTLKFLKIVICHLTFCLAAH